MKSGLGREGGRQGEVGQVAMAMDQHCPAHVHHASDSACYIRMSVTGTLRENAGFFLLMEVRGPTRLLQ